MQEKTLFCAGLGYSATALAQLLSNDGWRVIGTVRDEAGEARARASGAEPVPWPPRREDLAQAGNLLISPAPREDGDPTLKAVGDVIRELPWRWVGYLSTTGVYGDHKGAWVDEETSLTPATKRGELRVKAEAEWRDTGLPIHIFRLAGIYGPGRGPFSKVRNGTARLIEKPGQVFSRTHRDDIAAILAASLAAPNPGAYNVCDDEPAPPQDVIAHAADLLGVPRPPLVAFEEAEMTPMARSFYAESKRVSNRKVKDLLGRELAFPTYREGLAALLEEERAKTASP
ncbi:MAG: SDR family oxidoreductase [Pseudomonadota bacterium]